MTRETFLKPELKGARYEGGVIPLEMLKDLAALEQMVVELAKWKYREANPKRKRVPSGFTKRASLILTGVEEGSAIPVIALMFTASATHDATKVYYEGARSSIVSAISAAEHNQNPSAYIPEELLGYFNKVGVSLGDGESIEFPQEGGGTPAKLTKESRRRLVLAAASATEVTEEAVLVGGVHEVNQMANSFEIELVDGTKLKAPLLSHHRDAILEATVGYAKEVKVRMQATVKYNRAKHPDSIDNVEHIEVIDRLDVGYQIEEIGLLKHGWLNGSGNAPAREGLEWLSAQFDTHYEDDLVLPYLYPTAEGGVRAEWDIGEYAPSLEIDLGSHTGFWHVLLPTDNGDTSHTVDLAHPSGWRWLASELRKLGGTRE